MKFKNFGFDLFTIALDAGLSEVRVCCVEVDERHGSLFSFSVGVCQCGDPDCGGREIGFDLFWFGFFQN